MKRHWDTVVAGFGLMLGVVAMSGVVLTGEYAHAAGAEARGLDALFHAVADDHCDTAPRQDAAATLVALGDMDHGVAR